MKVTKVLDGAVTYISGAMSRIFGLDDDAYPKTGVQPFTGETHKEKHQLDR
jgi:hypothetical protein